MISIVTVNKNNAVGLEKTILSVLSQRNKNYEFIVVDGSSNDESSNILNQYHSYINKSFFEHDKGPYDAMNKGISASNGEFIIFLNSGDLFFNDTVIDEFYSKINTTEKETVYYGAISLDNLVPLYYPNYITLSDLKKWTINHNSCCIPKSLFIKYGIYDLEFKLAADYVWFLKIYLVGVRFTYIDKMLVSYDTSGLSSQNPNLYKSEMTDAFNRYVPDYLRTMLLEYDQLKLENSYTIIKLSKKFNFIFQRIKKYITR